MDFSKCAFNKKSKLACDASRGKSDLQLLVECQDNIDSHLRSCSLSSSGLTETHLILARAGWFQLSDGEIQRMMICPKHRHELGRYWRAQRSCQHPAHSGARKKLNRDRHVVNLTMAVEIKSIFKKDVGIGARK